MNLYLLRHGEAVSASSVGGRDYDRTLSPEGAEIQQAGARAMKRLGMRVDVILTSPYPRAEQTAQIVREAMGGGPEMVRVAKDLASGARPGGMAEVVRQATSEENVLLVGHNPEMEDFAAWLIGPDARARVGFSPGTLAHLRLHGEASANSAALVGLYPARVLALLAG